MSGTKTTIALEMVVLVGGHIVLRLDSGERYEDIVVHELGRVALATSILGAILLSLDEVGAGALGASFGGLVVLGYLLALGGKLGSATERVVNQVFPPLPLDYSTEKQKGNVT